MAKAKKANGKVKQLKLNEYERFIEGFRKDLKARGIRPRDLTADEVVMEMEKYLHAVTAARQIVGVGVAEEKEEE